jgi:hypothetical protein
VEGLKAELSMFLCKASEAFFGLGFETLVQEPIKHITFINQKLWKFRRKYFTIQNEFSMPLNFFALCNSKQPIKPPHARLRSKAWYKNIALPQCMPCTKPRARCWLNVYSLCKNIVIKYSHIQKWGSGIRQGMKEKQTNKGMNKYVLQHKEKKVFK